MNEKFLLYQKRNNRESSMPDTVYSAGTATGKARWGKLRQKQISANLKNIRI